MSRLETERSEPDERAVFEGLQRVTDAALAHLSEDDLLDELLLRVAEILRADTVAILLHVPERAVLRARAARGIEEEVEQRVEIPMGRGFAGRVAAESAQSRSTTSRTRTSTTRCSARRGSAPCSACPSWSRGGCWE